MQKGYSAMSDIVDRLRDYAKDDHERGCSGRYYDCHCGYDGKRDRLIDEAAARIEQLEAALREIAKHPRGGVIDTPEKMDRDEFIGIARAALGKSK